MTHCCTFRLPRAEQANILQYTAFAPLQSRLWGNRAEYAAGLALQGMLRMSPQAQPKIFSWHTHAERS